MNRTTLRSINQNKGKAFTLSALLVPAALVSFHFGTSTLANDLEPSPDRVARGEYLVMVAGCNDCHTPLKMGEQGPEPDMARMLSGHPEELVVEPVAIEFPWGYAGAVTNTAFSGPWGVSFTTNLTPDEDTGLGSWSEEIFIDTLRSGKHWGQSRPILPPMPWQNYARMTDEDLKSVFAYLRTIPPIKNHAPSPISPGEGSEPDPFAN